MRLLSSLAVLALASTAARADGDPTYALPEFLAKPPPLPKSFTGEVWRLDLTDALRIAVHENFGIALERSSLRISRLNVSVARGVFEPVVQAGLSHASTNTPPLTAQAGMAGAIVNDKTDAWQISLSDRLSTGMQLSVGFLNARDKSSAGTAVAPLNYRSSVQLSATQPVLRGFSLDRVIPELPVLRAKIATERERHQLALTLTDIVERTEDAYWDVVAAVYRYDLSVRSLGLADDQLRLTQRQIDSGVLPASDLIAAKSTLAQRKLNVVTAEEGIDAAWDQLRGIMNLPRAQWSRPILPIDVPTFAPVVLAPNDALELAVHRRPELAQADLDLQATLLSIREAENNKLPEIDVGATLNVVGQDTAYGSTLGQLPGFDGNGWSVFLNFTWTPLQRATSAQVEIERTRRTSSQINREQLVQRIWADVRDALRNQRTASRQVLAAASFRDLAEQSLAVEQRKFLNGTSFNYVVAQRQDELANAQLAELNALLAHSKANAALARATGQLLEQRHIELQ
jgi:outer membrane protein TolC